MVRRHAGQDPLSGGAERLPGKRLLSAGQDPLSGAVIPNFLTTHPHFFLTTQVPHFLTNSPFKGFKTL